MRRMLVLCEDGQPFHTEIQDGERLRITKAGNIRAVFADGRSTTVRMESPARAVYELVEEAQS